MSGLCSVCGSPDLSVGGDGFSYCNVCGSQSQFFQDQAFDYDDTHLYNARNVRERGIARKESQLATQQTLATQASQLATQEDLAYFQASQFQSQYQSQFGDDLMPFSQNPSQPITAPSESGLLESELGLSESERLAARVRKVYVEGVQVLVQMQCEALVQRFGVTPLVCGILGPVWMKFVSSTCVYEDGWADEALLVAEAHHEKSDKEDSDEDEEDSLAGLDLEKDDKPVVLRKEVKPKRKKRVSGEPWTTYGERTRFVWLRSLKARIPLRASLAITYLVCHLAREPVLPTDIINWAFEGTLPYLSAYTEIEKRSNWGTQLQLFKASKIFKPQRMTNARVVEYLASVIGDRIDLELPPINFHAIARRFLRELDLPVERLAPYVCRLYEWFPSSGLWLTSQVSKFPTRVYVMAMLVVVFKILYKLDGRHRLPHKDYDAISGVELAMETLRVQENEQWNSEEFVAKIKIILKDDAEQVDDQEQLTEYLRYCRETIFANEGMSNDEDLRDHFWDLYEQSAEQGALRGTIPKESEDVKSDFDRNGLLLLGSEENTRQKQKKTGKKSKKTLSKLRTDPLLRGMEDLGFFLLDPPKDVPQEHEYWTYIITRDDVRPVHEDYLFVLRACAKIIDVDPRVVHLAILNVEKGVIEAEKKVLKFLDLQKGISFGDAENVSEQMEEFD